MLVLGVVTAAAREARLQKRTTNGERGDVHAIALQQRRNLGRRSANWSHPSGMVVT